MARSSGLPDVQTHLVASYHIIMVVYDYDDDVQVHLSTKITEMFA